MKFQKGGPSFPPSPQWGWANLRIFYFHPISMKLETKRFSSVLNTNLKLILVFAQPPSPSPSRWVGKRSKYEKLRFCLIDMKLGMKAFSSALI